MGSSLQHDTVMGHVLEIFSVKSRVKKLFLSSYSRPLTCEVRNSENNIRDTCILLYMLLTPSYGKALYKTSD